MNRKAYILMGTGLAMMLLGWLAIFLQVVDVLRPSFMGSFLGWGVSFLGFLVGLGGVVRFFQVRKRSRER